MRLDHDGDLTIYGKTNAELKLKCGTSSSDNIIAFINSSGTTKGRILYDSDNNFMSFHTDGTASGDERLRIDSDGKLIVGTEYVNAGNAPADVKFFLSSSRGSYGGQATNAIIFDNQTAGVDKGGTLTLAGYSGTSAIAKAAIRGGNEGSASTNNGYFAVFTRPTSGGLSEKVRITSDGRMSIGVNPSIVQSLLNVKGNNDDGNQTVLLRLGNDSSGAGTGAAIVMGAGAGLSLIHVSEPTRPLYS